MIALNGQKLWRVIWEMDNKLRSKLKYHELTEEQYDIYQKIRDELWETITEEEIFDLFN